MKKIENHVMYCDTQKGFLVDLTLVFGKGKEPQDINDKKIKSLYGTYIKYKEGNKQ